MMWLPLPGLEGQTGASATTTNKQGKLEELLSIAANGTRNADLYFNIGVCYFEAGRPGKATLYYLKALGIDSAHKEARDNLNYLQDLLFMGSASNTRPFLERLLVRIYDFFSLDRLAMLCLLFALFTVFALHWLLHYPADRERALPLLVVMACVLLLLGSVVVLLVKQHRISTNAAAVVVEADAPLYESADLNQPSDRVAIEGTIVHVLASEGRFVKAQTSDNTIAWMRAIDLDLVVEDR